MVTTVQYTDIKSIFDIISLIKGHTTIDLHHFFGNNSTAQGPQKDDPTDYVGGTHPFIKNGKRNPMSQTTNNPNLMLPTVMAMRFLGQFAKIKSTMDQVITRPLAVFPNPTNGAAMSAYNFMNNKTFNQGISLQNITATVLLGSQALASQITQGHQLFDSISNLASGIGSFAGSIPGSQILNLGASSAGDLQMIMTSLATGFANPTALQASGFTNTTTQGITQAFADNIFSDAISIAKSMTQFFNTTFVSMSGGNPVSVPTS